MAMIREQIIKVLPTRIRENKIWEQIDFRRIQEIRIRANQPLYIYCDGNHEIQVVEEMISKEDIKEILNYASKFSLFAFEDEMRQGYITIEGGHRIGFVGKANIETGKVKSIRYISSINIRVAHQVLDCARKYLTYLLRGQTICHTLIISPPGCGKTTFLRDLIRLISNGVGGIRKGNIAVVDERSEIAGCYQGIAQNELGKRTDILDGCPKAEGMLMLIRGMSPMAIAIDEVGGMDEIASIQYAMHCGCKMLATAHGYSLEEIRNKPLFKDLLSMEGFERYLILGDRNHVGQVERIYDKSGNVLFENAW